MLDTTFLGELKDFYRAQLLDNIVPFWVAHCRDLECGGYVSCVDRDGSVYEWTKDCMWNSGRIIWTFSHLYNELQKNAEWLEVARHGAEFALKHGFGPDGRMYYSLTRDGRP